MELDFYYIVLSKDIAWKILQLFFYRNIANYLESKDGSEVQTGFQSLPSPPELCISFLIG